MESDNKGNALPNTYIPSYSTEYTLKLLQRLTVESLYQLCIRWTKSPNTQPQVPQESIYTQQGLCNKLIKEIKTLRKNPQIEKGDLIRNIVHEYWSDRLNLLQYAQLDCQLIIDDTEHFNWIYSTILDELNHEYCANINLQQFTESVMSKLSKLYLNHIYILKHPHLPLHILRIQVFDLNLERGVSDPSQPQVSPRTPICVCLPEESPYIFHSVTDDLTSNLILQTIGQCLPSQLHLSTSPDQHPIQSVKTIYTLKGGSRIGKSFGIWSQYADGNVDGTPLGALDQHPTLEEQSNIVTDNSSTALDDIASLRFQGVTKEQSTHHLTRKRQFAAIDNDSVTSKFASRVPLQRAEFVIQESIDESDPGSRSNIRLKFSGADVFGGLHELSVSSDPKKMVLNPEEIPHWLTGEDGATFGHIIDGKFYSSS